MHLTPAKPCSARRLRTSLLLSHIPLKRNLSLGLFYTFLFLSRGEASHQSRQNVIIVDSLKRAGYVAPGSQQVPSVFFLTFSIRNSTRTRNLLGPMDGCSLLGF